MNSWFRFPFTFSLDEKQLLKRSILAENMHRGKILAKYMISIELALTIFNILGSLQQGKPVLNPYMIMYIAFVILNVFLLLLVLSYESWIQKHADKDIPCFYHVSMIIYTVLYCSWGSILTLMDQRTYGQVLAYVVAIIALCVVYYSNMLQILVPLGVSTALLFVGLPYYQNSSEILMGHYINVTIFLIFSFIASRIIYNTYCNLFYSNILLNQINRKLEEEVKEKENAHLMLQKANVELRNLSMIDELSGIPNRRALMQHIDYLLGRQTNKSVVTSVIMMDIDYYKLFNDNYGHDEGDRVLKLIGQQVCASVRHSLDFAARVGGEEFMFIAWNTNRHHVARIAESIRNRVLSMKIPHQFSLISDQVTISLGTATGVTHDIMDFESLMRLADKALYMAKSGGRNCVKSLVLDHLKSETADEIM